MTVSNRRFSRAGTAVLLAVLATLAVPAMAVPPAPGSTAEFQAANKAHLMATWTPTFAVSAEQAEQNRRTAAQAWPTVLRLMPAACAKDDALACEVIATSQSLWSRLPNPRASRQQAAAKASSLYGQLCEADAQGYACRAWQDFLKKLEGVDAQNASMATSVLPAAWVDLARVHDRRCRAGSGKVYSTSGDCETALANYESRAQPQYLALREHLCTRAHDSSCHKLGRMSAEEEKKLGTDMARCEARNAQGCRAVAAKWAYARWSPGFAANARTWAQKGCDLDDASACMMVGELLLSSEYGTPDPAAALAPYARACKLATDAQDRERSCKIEAKIREWKLKQ